MSRLTATDFKWLATEVAQIINPSEIQSFATIVKVHSKNSRFDQQRFIDACADTLQAKQYDDGLSPELYSGKY